MRWTWSEYRVLLFVAVLILFNVWLYLPDKSVAAAIDHGQEQTLRRMLLEQAVRRPCPVDRWTW